MSRKGPSTFHSSHGTQAPRWLLLVVLLVVGVNALGGGYYGLSGAPGVPKEWLEGSPFRTYFIPSLILFFVIGGSSFFAAYLVFRKRRGHQLASIVAGLLLLGWIVIQVAIIGFVSWLQPAMAGAAVFIVLLSLWLKQISHGIEKSRAS